MLGDPELGPISGRLPPAAFAVFFRSGLLYKFCFFPSAPFLFFFFHKIQDHRLKSSLDALFFSQIITALAIPMCVSRSLYRF